MTDHNKSIVPKMAYKELLNERCLIVDGLSRCGKMLVGPLVTELKNVEYAQYAAAVDHIPILWRLGHLDDNAASSFLRMTADLFMYDRAVGRHLNTRFDDVYSVYRSLEVKSLMARTSGDEGKLVTDQFNVERRIHAFITHENIPNIDLWLSALPGLNAIYIERHPVDIAHSWYRRGWGHRWGTDPMAFIPAPIVDGKPLPWFALEFVDEYHSSTPPDRIISCILHLINLYEQTLNDVRGTPCESHILRVSFEHMATRPVEELSKIAAWLETELHPRMAVALARERVPRDLPIADRQKKFDELQGQVTPGNCQKLLQASNLYEEKMGLEQIT